MRARTNLHTCRYRKQIFCSLSRETQLPNYTHSIPPLSLVFVLVVDHFTTRPPFSDVSERPLSPLTQSFVLPPTHTALQKKNEQQQQKHLSLSRSGGRRGSALAGLTPCDIRAAHDTVSEPRSDEQEVR